MSKSRHSQTIRFHRLYGEQVASRAAITNAVADVLPSVRSVEFNFKDVDFVSRSAVHQVLIERDRLRSAHAQVKLVGRNKNVMFMFKAVKRSLSDEHKAKLKLKRFGDFKTLALSLRK